MSFHDHPFYSSTTKNQSINLNCSVNLSYEGVGGEKSDRSREQPEGDDHDNGVGEVEQGRHELVNLQLCHKVEDAVRSHVHRGPSRHDKRPPPPAVVLSTQLEVDHHDGYLGAGDG